MIFQRASENHPSSHESVNLIPYLAVNISADIHPLSPIIIICCLRNRLKSKYSSVENISELDVWQISLVKASMQLICHQISLLRHLSRHSFSVKYLFTKLAGYRRKISNCHKCPKESIIAVPDVLDACRLPVLT
jgi:hypothetical protein